MNILTPSQHLAMPTYVFAQPLAEVSPLPRVGSATAFLMGQVAQSVWFLCRQDVVSLTYEVKRAHAMVGVEKLRNFYSFSNR